MPLDIGTNIFKSVKSKVKDGSEKGVKIIAWNNLAVKIASDSSRLYAKNLWIFAHYILGIGSRCVPLYL